MHAEPLLPPRLSRIHVIGGPGTGKTTLAHRLGDAYGLPVYELDRVAYEGPEFRPRSPSACAARAGEISAQDRWVTEGIFVGWTEPLLARAETIVWLDFGSWGGSAARIVRRTLGEAVREVGRRRGRERFFRFRDYQRNLGQLASVLVQSRDFWASPAATRYPVTREDVQRALAPHAPKVVRVDSPEAASALRARG
jgi:adenylate kinase family enzyme